MMRFTSKTQGQADLLHNDLTKIIAATPIHPKWNDVHSISTQIFSIAQAATKVKGEWVFTTRLIISESALSRTDFDGIEDVLGHLIQGLLKRIDAMTPVPEKTELI